MKSTTKFAVAMLLFCAFATLRSSAQIAPQIQGAGAPTNPCFNGGQQYVDQTNHVIYVCPNNGGNWFNIGIGIKTGGGGTPAGNNNSIQYNNNGAFGGDNAITTDGSGNLTFHTGTVPEIAAPANPSAGNELFYANSTDHLFECLTSGGAACSLASLTFDANSAISGKVTVNSGNGLQAAQQVGNTVTLAAQNAAGATKGVLQLAGCLSNGSATSPQTSETVATHTGAGYTVVAGDACTTIGLSNAGSQTATLPNPIAANGTWYEFINYGAGNWTISPNGLTMNPTSSLVIGQNQSVRVKSDGTNYWYAAGRMVAGSTNTSEVVILDSNGNLLTSRAGAPIVRSAGGSDVTITPGVTNGNSVFGTGQNSGTNTAGHETIITGGPGTGNATLAEGVTLRRPLAGASGTTTESVADGVTSCPAKTLSNTSNTLQTLAKIALGTGLGGGVSYQVTVTCADSSAPVNVDSDTQSVVQSFKNHNGTIAFGTHQVTTSTAVNDSGSCTIAPTEADAGSGVININVQPVFTTIVPTTVTAYVTFHNNGSGNITCQ